MSQVTDFEKRVYDFIKEHGEVQVSNVPRMMWGAIPNLKKEGLLKTYKKRTTPWASKKQMFVRTNEISST